MILEALPSVSEGSLAGLELVGSHAMTNTSEAATMHRMVALGSTRLHAATMAADMTQGFQLEVEGCGACLLVPSLLVSLLDRDRGGSSAYPAAAELLLRSVSKALSLIGSRCADSGISACFPAAQP